MITRILLLAVLLGLSGCGDEDTNRPLTPGTATPSTQLTGSFLGGWENGLMSVTIAGASLAPAIGAVAEPETLVTATGVLSPDGGGVVNLTGTYGAATDSLALSGQGYTFLGYYWASALPPVIEGEYSGPNGTGSFSCFLGSTSNVKVFCGRFQSASTEAVGRWNIDIAGGVLVGLMATDGASDVVGFSGTVSGTSTHRTLSFSTSGFDTLLHGDGSWDTATNRVSGTWTSDNDFGTWSGDLCLPGTTGPN